MLINKTAERTMPYMFVTIKNEIFCDNKQRFNMFGAIKMKLSSLHVCGNKK